MNKVILKGNVGQDPKITTFQDGGKVAQFSLATTEKGFKTRDGKEIPEKTTWHNIVVKRTGLAGICEQYVKKGSPLLIEGKIDNREYQDNGGVTRWITEVVVDELELLSSGQKREQAPAPEPDREYQSIYKATDPVEKKNEPAVMDYRPQADPDPDGGSQNDLPF